MTLYPQVKVGRASVYVTGTVICRPGQVLEITPQPAANAAYRIQISFVDNHSLPGSIKVSNLPDNAVLVTITNFGNGISSTLVPVVVGELAGVQLFLDIAGYTIGSGETLVRVITYTISQGAA